LQLTKFDSAPQLTGLWPFYDVKDSDDVQVSGATMIVLPCHVVIVMNKLIQPPLLRSEQKLVSDGKLAYVDPRYRTRSYLEGKLVEIMERCWEYKRRKRLNIFEVVEFLRNVKVEAEKNGELGTAAAAKHGISI
jgi:hypothetical protein